MTTVDPNPFAPPAANIDRHHLPTAEIPTTGLLSEHLVQEVAAGPAKIWPLKLGRERLYLASPDSRPSLQFDREDFIEHCEIQLGGVYKTLACRAGKRLFFRLTPEVVRALREWIDPVLALHLAKSLSRRFRFSIPFGIVVALLAVQLDAGLAIGQLLLGIGLVALGVLGKARPHRSLYLGNALIWLLFCLNYAFQSGGMWGVMFPILGVIFATGSLRAYQFYAPIS
jgi:hypothetical protein